MFLVRLIGGLLGIALAYGIAYLFKLELIVVCTLMAYMLVIDSLIVKWIAHLYMKTILNQMQPPDKDDK